MIAILAGLAVLAWPWLVGRIVRRASTVAPARGALTQTLVATLDAAPILAAFGAGRTAQNSASPTR